MAAYTDRLGRTLVNTDLPSTLARRRPSVLLVLASAQLVAAVTSLVCAVVQGIREQPFLPVLGQWGGVPAPLVITGSAVAAVILIKRGRFSCAVTAAGLPLAVHILAMVSYLPFPRRIPLGPWVRQALTSPFGQLQVLPTPVLLRISAWVSMAAIVLGVVVAVGLAGAVPHQERRSPVRPGALVVVAVTSVLAIAAYWTGVHLDGIGMRLVGPTQPAFVALAAATVTALIDVHTRRAAREGMIAVAAVSAGVSGAVLIVPLGWQMWPLVQRWLRPPERLRVIGIGRVGLTRWQGLSESLISLGSVLVLVAVAAAALTAVHRAAAVRGTAPRTKAEPGTPSQ
ncbi:hypothetical protein [Actinoallomurus sp. CA-142502]|uniref:hypothetical protein n=1 Tax=Actinoallomurus sp. CA-142502 TaxID=3239885 RepID=UPI003D8B9473